MRSILLFILAAGSALAVDVPMTVVSEDEAEPIHSAIMRNEAWTQESVRRLHAEAEKRMREAPWSVTSDRPRGPNVGANDYYSEAPNWWPDPEHPGGPFIYREGRVNSDRFTANRTALNSMCEAVLTLGAAGFFLEETNYAQRAARLIHTWFINPKTRMNPNLAYAQVIPGTSDGRPAGILEGRVFIRAIQGMEFLAQTGAWEARDQAAVRKWFEEYLRWLMQSPNGIDERRSVLNHASWWAAQVAAIASFTGDTATREMAFNLYRTRILPRQVQFDLNPAREESRPALLLATSSLEASSVVCRIAQVHGVDLWAARTPAGANIGGVIDSVETYLADPRKWSREQSGELQNESLYFLAFAGMGLKKAEYVAAFHKLERPEGAWFCLVDLLVGRWEAAAHQTRR